VLLDRAVPIDPQHGLDDKLLELLVSLEGGLEITRGTHEHANVVLLMILEHATLVSEDGDVGLYRPSEQGQAWLNWARACGGRLL